MDRVGSSPTAATKNWSNSKTVDLVAQLVEHYTSYGVNIWETYIEKLSKSGDV